MCAYMCVCDYVIVLVLRRYQGYISAALVLGGVDATGPHIYSVHPHGSTDSLPYVTMGNYYTVVVVVGLQTLID